MKFLVTGSGGFIGGHLCRHLLDAGHVVRAVCSAPESADFLRVRTLDANNAKLLEFVRVERSCVNPASWQVACQGVDVVFHLAGRAHRSDKLSSDALEVYRRDNLEVTQALAKAAILAGVPRFIFISSATVYGTHSLAGQVFREDSPVAPHECDPYAISKREAEVFLQTPEIRALLTPTVVRLPLVYGAGVKGNMLALMRLVARNLPLPLASIDNRRSFVSIPNLVDFLLCAALNEKVKGQTLLVSDNEDVSTPTLIRAIALGLGKKVPLFAVSPRLLQVASRLLGQGARYEKLASNFQLDTVWSRDLLDWQPKTGFAEGIAEMCAAYKKI
ncbi:UDP-glucose 4-epimerase [Betaproteobacteria bacterium]|nr:UDP-glucose 4-epimerase [Betaproteobacteria bacterium]